MAQLRRTSDGAGDTGVLRVSDKYSPLFQLVEEVRVGDVVRVGSLTSRMFEFQDYWTTTPIIEIVSNSRDMCVFKTGNSEYTLWY